MRRKSKQENDVMLNPTYPKAVSNKVKNTYVAPEELIEKSIASNRAFDTQSEYRLQPIFGDELWEKLKRAGYPPERISNLDVLEVCAGTGFLTYHLLSKCSPKNLAVNDISDSELKNDMALIDESYPEAKIEWLTCDMYELPKTKKYDLIIGNSFIHHFHNVPGLLKLMNSLLKSDGSFISLHEPTLMSTVVESAKTLAYPFALLFPGIINEIARARYSGPPTDTDLWIFKPHLLKKISINQGFSEVKCYPWHLLRPFFVQKNNLHLSKKKPCLSDNEIAVLEKSISIDSVISRFLPSCFFGSITLVCKK